MANSVNNKNASKSLSISSGPKSFAHRTQPLKSVTSNKWAIGKGTRGQVASFLIKTIALEAIRRFSKARCPLLWNGLQGFQVLCYPPLKWVQCWKPLRFLVKGMQMISRPLLVLSIVDVVSDHSDSSNFVDNTENSSTDGDSQLGSESLSRPSSLHYNQSTANGDEYPEGIPHDDWLDKLFKELENQGITLPERFHRRELQRFYVAANGDFSSLLSSVKKTIRWRETYRLFSDEELEMWSNMIFWHGLDMKNQPCLIVRLGMGCRLPSHDRPRFVQALVSQVEFGVLHLVGENPQITVLLDCHGVSPLRFPMQTMRYCCNIFQDHFPNVLGCLIIIRLPPVVRVIAQTVIQVLKPTTRQKLRIEGEAYRRFLSEFFETVPSYLGGQCICTRCIRPRSGSQQQILDGQIEAQELALGTASAEDFQSGSEAFQDDIMMDNYCTHALRTAVIGILIVWVLIAFIAGFYDPESRPTLSP